MDIVTSHIEKTILMALVNDKYNESLNKMSGKQRVERTASLYSSFKEMLEMRVKKEFGGISGFNFLEPPYFRHQSTTEFKGHIFRKCLKK